MISSVRLAYSRLFHLKRLWLDKVRYGLQVALPPEASCLVCNIVLLLTGLVSWLLAWFVCRTCVCRMCSFLRVFPPAARYVFAAATALLLLVVYCYIHTQQYRPTTLPPSCFASRAAAPEGPPHDHALRLVERPGPVSQPSQPAAQPPRGRRAVRTRLHDVVPRGERAGHGGAQPRMRRRGLRPSLRGRDGG